MIRTALALMLAVASIAPAQAATSIILSPGNTALPSSTTAAVIQNFNTSNPDGSTFVPNSTNTNGSEVVALTPGFGFVTTTETPARVGLTGDYLAIGRRATYTISFLTAPVAFFSFAFNITNPTNNRSITLSSVDSLTLTFSDLTQEVLMGTAILGSPSTVPGFGRVSYDTGTGPKITSAAFMSRGNQPLRIDDIAAAVPEPAAWLMMILGFGMVGSRLRRRRINAKVTFATA